MTTDQAFAETMAAIQELRESGIRVSIKPSKSANEPEVVAKYSGPERIKPDKWVNVTLFPITNDQKRAVTEKARHLGWLGIAFDTGGSANQRDWELDWSFRYTGRPDGELEACRDAVEDLIESIESEDAGKENKNDNGGHRGNAPTRR